MNVGRVVFWAVLWIGVAVYVMATSEPIPRWLVAVLCATLAFSEVAAHVGERMSVETSRLSATTAALRVLGELADAHSKAGEPEKALVLLDASKAIGDLTAAGPTS